MLICESGKSAPEDLAQAERKQAVRLDRARRREGVVIRTVGGLSGLLVSVLAAGATVPAAASLRQGQPPSTILDKATTYVSAYVKALSSVVSEERYEQRVQRVVTRGFTRGAAAPPEKDILHRTLVSDYLLVQIPGSSEWMPFRDVYSVDGVPVRDRNDRLLKIFLEPGASTVARALQIREESSRYNLGSVTRDINVPTFALQILAADLRGRFAFKETEPERVGNLDAVVIEYSERAVPTIVLGQGDENVPASGRFWILPDTGAVVRSVMETRPPNMRTRIEVTYKYEPDLGIFVPGEMNERHDLLEEMVEARSTYSNFRRFRVDTSFQIK